MTRNTPTGAIFIRSRSGRATACASSRRSTPTAVSAKCRLFSPPRSRIQLTIRQRTRVIPRVARELVADTLVVAQDAARGAKRFFSAASALVDLEPQACPEHFDGVEIKLGVERALDVGGLAEAMLLTRE